MRTLFGGPRVALTCCWMKEQWGAGCWRMRGAVAATCTIVCVAFVFLYGLACLPVVCLLVGAGRVVLGDGGVMSVRTRGVAHDTTIFDSLIPNPLVSPTLFGPPPPKHEDAVERNHFLIFFSSIRAFG